MDSLWSGHSNPSPLLQSSWVRIRVLGRARQSSREGTPAGDGVRSGPATEPPGERPWTPILAEARGLLEELQDRFADTPPSLQGVVEPSSWTPKTTAQMPRTDFSTRLG